MVYLVRCDFCESTVNFFHVHVEMDGKEYTLCPDHFEIYKSEIFNSEWSEVDNDT